MKLIRPIARSQLSPTPILGRQTTLTYKKQLMPSNSTPAPPVVPCRRPKADNCRLLASSPGEAHTPPEAARLLAATPPTWQPLMAAPFLALEEPSQLLPLLPLWLCDDPCKLGVVAVAAFGNSAEVRIELPKMASMAMQK